MIRRPTPSRHIVIARVAVVCTVLTLLVAGCTESFSPERLPTPQTQTGGRLINVELSTVANLPDDARVVVDGVDAGSVHGIRTGSHGALISLALRAATRVDSKATVELKQDTLLGDTYVAIANPQITDTTDARTPLPVGGTLGAAQVKDPVQVENLLTSLANFLGSGSLPQLGSSFAAVNNQFPEDPAEVRRIEGTLVDTLRTWAGDTADLNKMLVGINALVNRLAGMRDSLAYLLSPGGVRHVKVITEALWIAEVLTRLDSSLKPLLADVPLLQALTRTVSDVVKPYLVPGWPDYDGQDSNATRLVELLTDKVIPFFKGTPALNIRRLAIANDVSDKQLADRMVRVYRTLGLVR
ncbi:MlaD family protein [Gordonia sp. CPCC 206044]|uniref:MlaD family protein n=1 Tax=Gordonia sp. CPCC 206044 TaxID=3140793 RepID=UPI003AF35CF7